MLQNKLLLFVFDIFMAKYVLLKKQNISHNPVWKALQSTHKSLS